MAGRAQNGSGRRRGRDVRSHRGGRGTPACSLVSCGAGAAAQASGAAWGPEDLALWSVRGFLARSPGSPTGKPLSTHHELVTPSSTQDPAWAPRTADRVVSPIHGGETESQMTHPRGRASVSAQICRTPHSTCLPEVSPTTPPAPQPWGARCREGHSQAGSLTATGGVDGFRCDRLGCCPRHPFSPSD